MIKRSQHSAIGTTSERLAFFGSVLGSDFRPDSDADILVEFDPGHVPGFAFAGLQDELSEMIGRTVDLHTPGSLSRHFREKVQREAQVRYVPQPGEITRRQLWTIVTDDFPARGNGGMNKIHNPTRLEHLIKNRIGQERWSELSGDIKGDACEGLLEKNAQDVKGGAGQFFTPRPLIDAIVDVIRPQPGESICDPACGTGGFLLGASTYVTGHNPYLDRDQKRQLKLDALRGVEIVDGVTRLCAMNMFLRGVGPTSVEEGHPPVRTDDSLRADPGERFDVVLTNPPFRKGVQHARGQ